MTVCMTTVHLAQMGRMDSLSWAWCLLHLLRLSRSWLRRMRPLSRMLSGPHQQVSGIWRILPVSIAQISAGSKRPEAKGKGRSKATADVTKSGTSANIEKLAVAKTAKPKARPIKKKKQDVVGESVTIIDGDRPEVQPEGSPSRDKSRRVLRAASSRV